MEQVIIGVDPHKLSATIEVVDKQEHLPGSGRFTTDKAGTQRWVLPDGMAGTGLGGRGRQRRRAPLAQWLVEAGEQVVDVPAKLAARVRLFDTGHNRKTVDASRYPDLLSFRCVRPPLPDTSQSAPFDHSESLPYRARPGNLQSRVSDRIIAGWLPPPCPLPWPLT